MAGPLNELLDWSPKQGRILTGGGVAEALYTAERGFPFDESELPHYHLTQGTTAEFTGWRAVGRIFPDIAGCWDRPLFTGGFEHSTNADERVFNTQTPSLFIDMRIPQRAPDLVARGHRGLATLSDDELRAFARRHCFAGYSLLVSPDGAPPVVTRHHVVDWNFVGAKRTRPNKWRVERHAGGDAWKEWSFAADAQGQSYYMERWARRGGDGRGAGTMLALRARPSPPQAELVLLVVGDHFAVARGRAPPAGSAGAGPEPTLVGRVDGCLARGDRAGAEHLLSLEGAHGRVAGVAGAAGGWVVDAATHPWQEGRPLAELLAGGGAAHVAVRGWGKGGVGGPPPFLGAMLLLGGLEWEVFECSFAAPELLEAYCRDACAAAAAADNYAARARLTGPSSRL
jgi:hypothetical protein